MKISIGPPIENGFYYDFEFPPGVTLSDADFAALEDKMREHVKADETFVREDVPVAEARERFAAEDQPYKVELIDDLIANRGVETVSLYTNGPFTDLCRGPHAPSTGRIKAFKLQSVAGAYWRGDADSTMLTRVYGTAFFSNKELDELLERLELRAPERPPQARPRARALHVLRGLTRLAVLAAQRDGDLERALRAVARAERRARLQGGRRRRSSSTSSSSRSPATGTSTATTCTSPTWRSGRWASSP